MSLFFKDRDGNVIDVYGMEIPELEQAITAAEDAIASIEIQLMQAQLEEMDGNPRSPDWTLRARISKRIQGRLLNCLQVRLGKLKKNRSARNYYKSFYESAVEVLPPELFGMIKERAEELVK